MTINSGSSGTGIPAIPSTTPPIDPGSDTPNPAGVEPNQFGVPQNPSESTEVQPKAPSLFSKIEETLIPSRGAHYTNLDDMRLNYSVTPEAIDLKFAEPKQANKKFTFDGKSRSGAEILEFLQAKINNSEGQPYEELANDIKAQTINRKDSGRETINTMTSRLVRAAAGLPDDSGKRTTSPQKYALGTAVGMLVTLGFLGGVVGTGGLLLVPATALLIVGSAVGADAAQLFSSPADPRGPHLGNASFPDLDSSKKKDEDEVDLSLDRDDDAVTVSLDEDENDATNVSLETDDEATTVSLEKDESEDQDLDNTTSVSLIKNNGPVDTPVDTALDPSD